MVVFPASRISCFGCILDNKRTRLITYTAGSKVEPLQKITLVVYESNAIPGSRRPFLLHNYYQTTEQQELHHQLYE